jgi:phenol hydroxylase P5 protein
MAEATQRARVIGVRELTPNVRELRLLPLQQPISFEPGQWVSLKLPIGDRNPLTRAYTMAEPPSSSGELVLVFDRVPHGLGSEYLFHLEEGTEIDVAGPYGRFVLPAPLAKDTLFLARYTGVVPVRCMLQQELAPNSQVVLIYTMPSDRERLYHAEFTELASRRQGFQYVPLTSNLHSDAPVHEWPESKALQPYITQTRSLSVFVSGVRAFVRPLRGYLAELGFERREIRAETYD